ncbi:MAG: recombination mediator RecR [Bacteriovoracaceae bacterium]
MNLLPEQLKKAVEYFSKLPGVGEKTATRQVLVLTHWDSEKLLAFSEAIKSLMSLEKCIECGMFAREHEKLCEICFHRERAQAKSLCIVESVTDCIAIEKSGYYKGLFHVLGGVLNPLIGIGPDELGIDQLVERIERLQIEELILAINPSVEGDATCSYLKQQMKKAIRVERIGFGIPMGGSLEYLDAMTITKALENRKTL